MTGRGARADRVDAGRRPAVDRGAGRCGGRGEVARHSAHRDLPRNAARAQERPRARRRSTPRTSSAARSRAVKEAHPDLGMLCDVALDPFTTHGHDGVLREGDVANDETVEILCRQALVQAEAGCDVIAPSRHDGRARRRHPRRARRAGLRARPHHGLCREIRLRLLGPFRDAIGSKSVARQGRQAQLPDGSGQWRRGAARGGARPRRGRRHGDGEARHALSRHRAPGEGALRRRRPTPIRSAASTRC